MAKKSKGYITLHTVTYDDNDFGTIRVKPGTRIDSLDAAVAKELLAAKAIRLIDGDDEDDGFGDETAKQVAAQAEADMAAANAKAAEDEANAKAAEADVKANAANSNQANVDAAQGGEGEKSAGNKTTKATKSAKGK